MIILYHYSNSTYAAHTLYVSNTKGLSAIKVTEWCPSNWCGVSGEEVRGGG